MDMIGDFNTCSSYYRTISISLNSINLEKYMIYNISKARISIKEIEDFNEIITHCFKYYLDNIQI